MVTKHQDKQNCNFILSDIKDFNPTITEELLSKCFSVAERKIQISEDDKKIIHYLGKPLLFDKENTWMNKGRDVFDVAMETYDGTEVCEHFY